MTKGDCSASRLAGVSEFELIRRLTAVSSEHGAKCPLGVIGPGDDCAVVPSLVVSEGSSEHYWLVFTTDVLVENVHFCCHYSNPFQLGIKCLGVNLSDIAAMGATPKGYVITLQLTNAVGVEFVEELYRGLNFLGSKHAVMMLGGDTVSAGELAFGITVFGVSKKKPILRSGASVGDDVWLSGEIGGAGAGLLVLQGKLERNGFVDRGEAVIRRQQMPIPRVELGKLLLERSLASALIDISDGLLQDAEHIAEASDVRLNINLSGVPLQEGIISAGYNEAMAITAGEDYELLFAAPKGKARELASMSEQLVDGCKMPKLSRIGVVEAASGDKENRISIVDKRGEVKTAKNWVRSYGLGDKLGFDHFSKA
ncbi:MAG: thiamine-phosphate kinase [Deltaproteobacteria bacterium]|nr:thiamine-phosphate kinase [Deltaproteobacteria bacterium]